MEHDEENVTGDYSADWREYDSRLGRWLSKDPVVKPWESPYAGFANNPIVFVDPSGLDSKPKNPKEGEIYQDNAGNDHKYHNGEWEQLLYTVTTQEVVIAYKRTIPEKIRFAIKQAKIKIATAVKNALDPVEALIRLDRVLSSVGVSLEGNESNHNDLASKAAPNAHILVIPQEVYEAFDFEHSSDEQVHGGPYREPSQYGLRGQKDRLAEERNTGRSTPDVHSPNGDLFNAADGQPVLKKRTFEDNSAEVNLETTKMLNGETDIYLWIQSDVGPVQILVPMTDKNIAAAKKSSQKNPLPYTIGGSEYDLNLPTKK